MWGKDDGDYDFPISRDETPDEKIKEAKEAQIKKEAKEAHKKREKKKMREKERRGNATILFPHLCFKVAPWSSL